MNRNEQIKQLEKEWNENPRWADVERPYTAEEVVNLRSSVNVEYTLAKLGAEKFWNHLQGDEPICALGAVTGNQAVQEVQAGLKAIYCSGWQVAGDNNSAGTMYPDQSLYPVDSVPKLVEKINNALTRTDEIHWQKGDDSIDWIVPIIADAEAGFGGNLNAFELMKHMIKAGASVVHYEDQLSSAKKCGHLGGKVLVTTSEAVNKLVAARLATDVMGTSTLIIARTDANAANLLTTDVNECDRKFVTGERSPEGFHYVNNGLDQAIDRGLSYAPFADLLWCETAKPNLDEARQFADSIHREFPDQMFAYNCSPSFNWKAKLNDKEIRSFKDELGELNVKFQFITLAGFHSLNYSMFELSEKYRDTGMSGFVELQEKEFAAQERGFTAVKHQREVGASYFDQIGQICTGSTGLSAIKGSTEEGQF